MCGHRKSSQSQENHAVKFMLILCRNKKYCLRQRSEYLWKLQTRSSFIFRRYVKKLCCSFPVLCVLLNRVQTQANHTVRRSSDSTQFSWRHIVFNFSYLMNLVDYNTELKNILIMFAWTGSPLGTLRNASRIFLSSRIRRRHTHIFQHLCGCEEIRRQEEKILKAAAVSIFSSLFLKYLKIENFIL